MLIHTDLPEPVAPAISICGIFAISAIIVFPAISLPTPNDIADWLSLNSLDSTSSLKYTLPASLLGTSIPIAALPGIGASILMSARLSLISSDKETILLTLTPCSGCNSYLVTVGPQLISVIVTLTPKVSSVSCNLCAVTLYSDFPPDAAPGFLFNKLTGGNLYAFLGLFTGLTCTSVFCSSLKCSLPCCPLFWFTLFSLYSSLVTSFSYILSLSDT